MLGNYQHYLEYKGSNIEWVGDIPESWSVKPLFGVVATESVKNENGNEKNVLSLSYGNIIRRDVDKNFGLLPESFNTYQLVNHGELILRLTDLQNDKRSLRVGRATERGIITSAYLKLIANKTKMNNRYLYRLLHSYDTTKVFYGMGGGLRQSMKFEEMRRMPILVPALVEQQKIVNFLDHETYKIDTLIEKQQQLIKLLKEKCQAVISHAVTKGLNSNAPLRDSGVEWLGEVPEHWERKSLNYLIAHTVDNRGRTPPVDIKGIPMVEVSQVAGNGFYTSNDYSKFITQESYDQFVRSDVKENDILFVTVGATFGKTCLVPSSPDFFIAQNVVGFRCTEDVDPKFFMFLLSSSVFKEAISATNKSSTIDNIKVSDLVKTRLVVPPHKEQIEIANHMFMLIDQYKQLVSKAESAILLMQERRIALISAAVTGKIDVRNWQAPNNTNT